MTGLGPFIAAMVVPLLVPAQPRLILDWPAVANSLVAQLALEPAERVLLVAAPGVFNELIPHIRYALMRAGAVDLGVIDILKEPVPEDWDVAVLKAGATRSREAY